MPVEITEFDHGDIAIAFGESGISLEPWQATQLQQKLRNVFSGEVPEANQEAEVSEPEFPTIYVDSTPDEKQIEIYIPGAWFKVSFDEAQRLADELSSPKTWFEKHGAD